MVTTLVRPPGSLIKLMITWPSATRRQNTTASCVGECLTVRLSRCPSLSPPDGWLPSFRSHAHSKTSRSCNDEVKNAGVVFFFQPPFYFFVQKISIVVSLIERNYKTSLKSFIKLYGCSVVFFKVSMTL